MKPNAHPVDQHVGRRLRQIRRGKKVKQPVLAEFIGVSPQLIQRYEVGETRICASRLYDLAEALEVTVPDFFDGLDSFGTSVAEMNESGVGVAFEILQRDETQQLMTAFTGIKNDRARQKILELARAIGRKFGSHETDHEDKFE